MRMSAEWGKKVVDKGFKRFRAVGGKAKKSHEKVS
jgi:hypothetical protein